MSVLDLFRLDGRAAIVTGASSGLGVTIAQALAEAGADVALGARRADRLEATKALVEATGRRAIAVQTDVAEPDDCARLVRETVEAFGRLDVLVNNAGVGVVKTALKQDPADFRRMIEVNLMGCHWMACRSAEAMEHGGSIINISSMLAFVSGGQPQASYQASKAGLLGLTRDLAHEWTGRRGIRVNAIAPGYFATEMTEEYADGLAPLLARTAFGRMGESHELNGAVLYLASDASSYVTGQTIVVDGGFTTA